MPSRFYKNIDIDKLEIIQSIIAKRLDNVIISGQQYPDRNLFVTVPELIENLTRLGYDLKKTYFGIHISVTSSQIGHHIHIDNPSSTHPDYSLNIPIKNCANTFLNFFKTGSVPICIPERTINGIKYRETYVMHPTDPVLLKTVDAGRPILVNIKIPHNILNINSTSRIALLVRSYNNDHVKSLFYS